MCTGPVDLPLSVTDIISMQSSQNGVNAYNAKQ